MSVLNNSPRTGKSPLIGYRSLSVILGIVTLLVFGIDRYLYETAGQSLGEIPAYVMGSVFIVVGIGSFYASISGRGIKSAVILSLGPAGGLLVYLIGYHLVLPPSTDSPTSLIFLAFAGALLVVGSVAYLCGRLVRGIF